MEVYITNPIAVGTLAGLCAISIFCLVVLTLKIFEICSILSRTENLIDTIEYKTKNNSGDF